MEGKKATALLILVGAVAYLLWKFYMKPTMSGTYSFPNGYSDLDNWQNADDGTDTVGNRQTKLMLALAQNEGYGVDGAIPTQANNPGDLTNNLGFSSTGETLGAGIVVFTSRDDGWAALQHELDLAAGGLSGVYNVGMTIQQFVEKWTNNTSTAASNVASSLGTSLDDKLGNWIT